MLSLLLSLVHILLPELISKRIVSSSRDVQYMYYMAVGSTVFSPSYSVGDRAAGKSAGVTVRHNKSSQDSGSDSRDCQI